MPFKTTSTETSNTTSRMLLLWFYHWPLYNMCTGVKSTTSFRWYWVFLDQWYWQEGCVAHYEQVVNNVVSSFVDNLFIVGSTTLFTSVNINWEQVVDFLNFYVCTAVLFITDSETITSWVNEFFFVYSFIFNISYRM
jgi:hypothetical protein